jgi:hypothetical protein
VKSNLDKFDWKKLSENLNAIHLLEQKVDKVHWRTLSQNPAVFEEEVYV